MDTILPISPAARSERKPTRRTRRERQATGKNAPAQALSIIIIHIIYIYIYTLNIFIKLYWISGHGDVYANMSAGRLVCESVTRAVVSGERGVRKQLRATPKTSPDQICTHAVFADG